MKTLVFLGGDNAIFQPTLAKTTDGGQTWDFESFYLNNNEGKINGIFFTDQNNGYAVSTLWNGEGAISKTVDNGQNWSTQIHGSALYGIHFPPTNSGTIGAAAGDDGKIWRTANSGLSWQLDITNNANTLYAVKMVNADTGYAVGTNGTVLKLPGNPEPSYLGAPHHFSAMPNGPVTGISLAWETPLTGNEFAYDDGSVEGSITIGDAAAGELAVRFTPSVYPATLLQNKSVV